MRVVQKYGGTSVGSVERIERVADRVLAAVKAGVQCIVVVSAMGDTTDELVALARSISRYPDAREFDQLLATGEQVSAALLAIALHKRNVPARSFTGWQAGIVTEPVHGNARLIQIHTNPLEETLTAGGVAVVTGFQGVAGAQVTTLGRGGSDTSAVALAAAMAADLCEIYTDVAGVFTTDPRIVTNARRLPQISYDEMLELANLGAQVLHPRAVENARQFGVRLVVRSAFEESEGTLVTGDIGFELRESVTGVACEREVARIGVIGLSPRGHGLARVFGQLATAGVNVDVIVQSVVQAASVDVSFTVQEADLERAVGLLQELQPELGFREIYQEAGLSKVSIVGAGMISNPGVAASMFATLATHDILVQMVSTSEIKVSCIVPAAQVDQAVRRLHATFLE